MAAWIRTTNTLTNQRVIAKGQVGVMGNFLIRFDAQTQAWEFVVRDRTIDDWRRATLVTTAPNDGQWHHIAGVVDDGNDQIRLYVDGVVVATDVYLADTLDDSDNEELVIGADSDLGAIGSVFDGALDDIRIYHRRLTGTEVALRSRSRTRVRGRCLPAGRRAAEPIWDTHLLANLMGVLI